MGHHKPATTLALGAAVLLAATSARADITYVDVVEGAAGNTFATGGSPGNTGWVNFANAATADDDQWMKRALGNGATVFQALHSGTQMPELTTEIGGLADGNYDVWVFFWDGQGSNTWTISAGLASGALTTYSFDGPGNTALPVAASTLAFSGTTPMTTEDVRTLYGVKIGQSAVAGGNPIRVYVDNLTGGGSNTRTWYDGVGYAPAAPPPPPPLPTGPFVFGIDFNRGDTPGAPSQSLYRIVAGSATQSANLPSYTKNIGSTQVVVSRPDGQKFEFRGANGDSSRAIPGGDTSRPFLVSDFIATRAGAIDISITGLAAGDYVFRSHHLDTLTGSGLGFAQGSSATTPNLVEARVGGVLKASVQPDALGPNGLNTTFIGNGQIPALGFAFSHDGTSPLVIELRSTLANGADRFLLLNGFEILESGP